nr:CHASE2 domain-containing protein [Spirochaetota bacterium]
MIFIQKLSNLNIKSLLKHFFIVFALFIFTFLFFLAVDKNRTINSKIYDNYLKLRLYIKGKQYIDYKIVHVDIDETIYKKSGIYSERLVYAKILDNLKKIKPAYTFVDTIFTDLKKSDDDLTLADSIKDFDNLYFPVIFIPEILDNKIIPNFDTYVEFDLRKYLQIPKINYNGYPYNFDQIILNYTKLQTNIKNIGHNYIIPDKDGVIRKVPLYIKYKGLYAPMSSFKIAADYFDVSSENIEINYGKNIILKEARVSEGVFKNIKIPIDNKGNMFLNYPSESKNSFIRYSAYNFLDDKYIEKLSSELKGNIVILSENDAFNSKYYSTPYDNFFQLSGVHSVLINSILNEKFIYNPSYFIYFLVYIIIIMIYSVFSRYFNINKLIVFSIIMIGSIIFFSLSLFILFNIYFDIFIIVVTIEISAVLLTLYKYSNVKFNNLLL